MNIALLVSVFGAGMLATINPCGFAMLPAYISYFLNLENISGESSDLNSSTLKSRELSRKGPVAETKTATSSVFRAIVIGGVTTFGFLILFAIAGTIISLGARVLIKAIPWIGLVIGALLVFLGIWLLTGHHLSIPGLPSLKFERKRNLTGFFVFGIAYGLASLTCTLPIFLAVIGSVFATGGILQALAQFLAYSVGMGTVIVLLTISLAFFKGSMLKYLRKVVPFVERISAVLLLGAGVYIAYYWLVAGRLIFRIG